MKNNRMKDIYTNTEQDIHFTSNELALEANFSAYDSTCWYEDGMFNRNYRDFDDNIDFETAYMSAVKNATSEGRDPHIRWRARTFEFFLRRALPGNCIEVGTAHGFLFFFALSKLMQDGFDLSNSSVTLVDKFDQDSVDSLTGEKTGARTIQYANSVSVVKERFAKMGNTRIVQGLVPKIFDSMNIPELSFIHIDLNAAQPEVEALTILFPYLKRGGYIVLDDYGFPELIESRIAHDKLSRKIGYDILSLPTGQGLIIK